jgi:hypothetical protein
MEDKWLQFAKQVFFMGAKGHKPKFISQSGGQKEVCFSSLECKGLGGQ